MIDIAVTQSRTADPTLTMGVLYQLSYNGSRKKKFRREGFEPPKSETPDLQSGAIDRSAISGY